MYNQTKIGLMIVSLALLGSGCGSGQVALRADEGAADSVEPAAKAPQGQIFKVADFGATGDGVTDDGPAIRRAVAAAIAAGPGARVVFEDKAYRLDHKPSSPYHINLEDVADIHLEGNGALLINNPRNSIMNLTRCSGVTVTGFQFDVEPLPFTQGTVVAADPDGKWFDMEVHPGYRCPVEEFELHGDEITPIEETWGMFLDPVERHRKRGVMDHIRMQEVRRSPQEGAVRVCVNTQRSPTVVDAVKALESGDRYVLPFSYEHFEGTVYVNRSTGCVFEDIEVYATKYGMTFRLEGSEGQITFRRIYMGFRPGSDRLMSTASDGFHCKHNRVGPLIEDSHFEGLLDDSINVSVTASFISAVEAPRVYRIRGEGAEEFRAGDRVMAYTPDREEVLDDLVVESVEDLEDGYRRLTLNREIPNPGLNLSGDYFPGGFDKMGYTGLYNLDACGQGYIIRNNVFLAQRRHAVLARAPNGLIEGNLIDRVGGSAIFLGNEVGSFYEGPFPSDTVIRDNTIRNPMHLPIAIETRGSRGVRHISNIQLIGNRLETEQNLALRVRGVEGLLLKDNRFMGPPGVPQSDLIQLYHTTLVSD